MINGTRHLLGFRLFAATALFVASACGKGGSGGHGSTPPVVQPAPPPPDPMSLRTTVGMDTMTYGLKGLTACLARQDAQSLPILASDLTMDGDLGEWANVSGMADDPIGDAPTGLDLTYVAVAARGEDLAIALAPVATSADVYMEIGGITSKDGVLTATIRRVLRVTSGQLQDYVGSAFQPVAPESGGAMLTATGGEILLTRRLLGDAVTHPLWWVRVFTRDSTGQIQGDSTAAQYFSTMLGSDEPPFELATCSEWIGRRLPMRLLQIRDARGGTEDVPLAQTSERVYELTRMAMDATVGMLGLQALPVSRLTALATLRPVGVLTDATGFGLDKDLVAAGYRGFFTDARDLAPNAVDAFPQGPFVAAVSGRIIEMVLRQAFPAADTGLVNAWREALVDLAMRQYFGTSYWLDHYANRLGPVLTLAPLAAGDAVDESHALGFGRLMAQELQPTELLAVWREAAAAGGDPSTALRSASAGHAANAAASSTIADLWSGWLTAGDFAASSTPGALGDTDLDGVPDHIERKVGTASDRTDSDNDGWSDLAELVSGTDPTVKSKTPGVIMPDSDFGDWQELMPKRLGIDRGKSGVCPKGADITFYAALATRDSLVVGAIAAEYWENEPNARWEVEFDMPKNNEQRLVTGIGGSREYVVQRAVPSTEIVRRYQRAMPVARRTIEWSVERQALGLDNYFDVEGAVRLRLRTIFKLDGQELVCDETDWFTPSISGVEQQ